MNAADGRGPVDRDVGRVRHWTDTASRDELQDYCRHAEDDLRAQADELDRLRADAEVGRKWRTDSSLAEWFPFTAQELDRLRAENESLRYVLGVYVYAKRGGEWHQDIEAKALALLTPNA